MANSDDPDAPWGTVETRFEPIHSAARMRDVDAAERELDRGTAVDVLNERAPNGDGGNTALWFAAQGSAPGGLAVVRLLVQAGADVNRQGEHGRTALHMASIRMPDREACAAELSEALPRANVPAKCAILDVLGAVGGGFPILGTTLAFSESALLMTEDTAAYTIRAIEPGWVCEFAGSFIATADPTYEAPRRGGDIQEDGEPP